MNNTFLLWLGVAGAIAVGLLLLLGAPAAVDSSDAADLVVETRDTVTTVEDESIYWDPVASSTATVAPVASAQVVYVDSMRDAVTVVSSSGCCPTPVPTCSPCGTFRETPLVGGCSHVPLTPCGTLVCDPIPACSVLCGDPCYRPKPGINRNMIFCVDECGFIQLHSTVPHPICGQATFRWGASRGSFLDPTDAAPMYYAPATYMPGGEDVWITLTVIARDGTEYADRVTLHINNVR